MGKSGLGGTKSRNPSPHDSYGSSANLPSAGLAAEATPKLEIPMRAIQTRSERLKDLVSSAYKEKYNTPGSIQYVKDMSRKKLRETTTELVPFVDVDYVNSLRGKYKGKELMKALMEEKERE